MDDDRVVPAVSKDTYLKERPADRRANHHGQVVVHLDSADCISDCVLHVGVGDFVDSGGLANPHSDNIYCLSEKYKRTPILFSRQANSRLDDPRRTRVAHQGGQGRPAACKSPSDGRGFDGLGDHGLMSCEPAARGLHSSMSLRPSKGPTKSGSLGRPRAVLRDPTRRLAPATSHECKGGHRSVLLIRSASNVNVPRSRCCSSRQTAPAICQGAARYCPDEIKG
jgi:hypothetical protein